MAGPDWALFVLVVYPLAQIPLVLILARRLKLDGSGPVVTPTMAYWTDGVPDERLAGGGSTQPGRCRRCGSGNDPTFDYCRNCVAPLS